MIDEIISFYDRYEPFPHICTIILLIAFAISGCNKYNNAYWPRHYIERSTDGFAARVDVDFLGNCNNFVDPEQIYYYGCQDPWKDKHYFDSRKGAINALKRFKETGGHAWRSGDKKEIEYINTNK